MYRYVCNELEEGRIENDPIKEHVGNAMMSDISL